MLSIWSWFILNGWKIPVLMTLALTGKEVIKAMPKTPRLLTTIPLKTGQHRTILGITQHGKTYGIKNSLSKVNEGVFFYNVQAEKMPKPFIKADKKTDINIITQALKQEKKINYIPDDINKEISAITKYFLNQKNLNIFFAVDEMGAYEKEGLNGLRQIAFRGLSKGLNGIFIGQRGTMIHNDILMNSTEYVIFTTPAETDYWKKYSVPIDEIMERINSQPKMVKVNGDLKNVSFCTFSYSKGVQGAYAIK